MTIKAKRKKKKRHKPSDPSGLAVLGRKTSGGGAEGAAWHSECRFSANLCPSIDGGASKISRLFLHSLPLSPFLITKRTRESTGIKQKKKVEKERVGERTRERERERERGSGIKQKKKKKQRKKGEEGDRSGYTHVAEKKQEKKKKKRMDERKEK